jgi:hypothetical protein
MLSFKLGFAILFAAGAIFSCRVIVNQILQALQTGHWRGRTGIAYRSRSPKTFWLGLCSLSIFAASIALAASFLLIAALP